MFGCLVVWLFGCLGRAIAARAQLKFFPSFLIGKQLGLHPLVLSKLTSSIFVNPGKVDVGLRLKFQRQGMVVADYCRRVDTGYRRQHLNSSGEPDGMQYFVYTACVLFWPKYSLLLFCGFMACREKS